MAAPTWNVKPGYTPAQIAARFGPGARLVPAGNGKWTVAGATASAASAATPPPAPPPAVSFGAQAGIDSISGRLSSLPGVYNPQRLALYTQGARGLTDDGYFDRARVDVAGQTADGSTSYGVAGEGQGQRFRDASQQIDSAFGSRGAFHSTARRNATIDQGRTLENARQAILRQMAGQQDDITRGQTEQTVQLRGDLNSAQGSYTDWRASQPVPPPPSGAPMVTAPGPSGPPGPNNPRSSPQILRNPGASWTPQKLRTAGYKQAGPARGRNVWVRR